MADNASLISLAETISQSANAIASQLREQGLSAPSFAEDGLADYPKQPELMGLRMQLIDAAADMYRLAMGPIDNSFMGPLFFNYDATVMDILNQFDFWHAVPLGGSATYSEIAAKVNLPESLVRRVLRYAFTIRMFAPTTGKPASVSHTSLSAAPAKHALFSPWLRHHLYESRLTACHLPEALRKFNSGKAEATEELLETSFTLASHDRLQEPQSFWDYLNRPVEGKPKNYRATDFTEAMQAMSYFTGANTEGLLKTGYDWSQLGEATVIDVGGSSGHDALCIAKAFPKLNFVVQDTPETESGFNEHVPEDLRSRVRFEAHDFFGPQKTRGDVYMMKTILHDWSDKYAAKIVQNLVPHLEQGSRLLLVEAVAAPPGARPPFQTLNHLTAMADLQMLAYFNALERTLEDWKTLLGKVDSRLHMTYISDVPGSFHNFIEIKISS